MVKLKYETAEINITTFSSERVMLSEELISGVEDEYKYKAPRIKFGDDEIDVCVLP